jgi:dTDP-glucose 4,6-dehydratase
MSEKNRMLPQSPQKDPMRIMLTGGCGFIGSALVRWLIEKTSAEVLNIDKLTYAGNRLSVAEAAPSPRYSFRRLDICDTAALNQEVAAFEPDRIIHLAAESHVDRSIDGPSDFIQTNLVGTYAVLESARRYWSRLPELRRDHFRVVHVSTDEVYGSLPLSSGTFSEDTPYRPNSPYAATKAGSDHLARAWHRTYGLPVVVSNCSNNYGPYQFPEKVIPTMVLAGMTGAPMPVYGTGANIREWLYVDDHVRALLVIAERGNPGQTYLVGSGVEISNLDLVREICRILDELIPESPFCPHEKLIQFVPDRPGHDLRYAIGSARLHNELGWRPQETFNSGLRKTVAWYFDNRAWWEPLRNHRYDGRRLGLAEGVGVMDSKASND